ASGGSTNLVIMTNTAQTIDWWAFGERPPVELPSYGVATFIPGKGVGYSSGDKPLRILSSFAVSEGGRYALPEDKVLAVAMGSPDSYERFSPPFDSYEKRLDVYLPGISIVPGQARSDGVRITSSPVGRNASFAYPNDTVWPPHASMTIADVTGY